MTMTDTQASLPRSAAGSYNPWLIAVIVSIATFMEVLDTTIANVALRHIAGGLGASQDQSTYITTSYLVSNAIVLPISGWLANVVGRKRFYMICVLIFTVSSVACGFATSLPLMIVFRVLQGFGGGGLAPVEQSIFADTFTPEKRAMAFALYGLTVVTAPAIGPMLGGWITENYSWHWVFLINFPVGVLSLVLTGMFVSDSKLVKEERKALLSKGLRIDYFGFALIAVGFGCLQILLDKFERNDGFSSPFICWLAGISAVSLLVLVFWEFRVKQPIVNLRLFKSSAFAISCSVMFAFGFIINSTTQILPQFTQVLLGYDATNAGLTLGLGGLITLIFMPVAGIVTGRVFQPKWLVMMSLAGTGIALFHASGLDLNVGFWDISLSRLYQVIWLPFLFIPLSAVQFIGIPPKENNNASALINMMRNLGGSFGVSLVTTQLAWREQFHHARLAEHITPYNGFATALGSIASTVEQQASVMSYLDVFIMLGCIALVLCPICIFLPKLQKGAQINAH
jgi:MFS transporter, DHA2 family, multidrug resistance protein